MISAVVMPDSAAVDDEAPRVECAENVSVSIPLAIRMSFIHLAIVEDVMGLCGEVIERKS